MTWTPPTPHDVVEAAALDLDLVSDELRRIVQRVERDAGLDLDASMPGVAVQLTRSRIGRELHELRRLLRLALADAQETAADAAVAKP